MPKPPPPVVTTGTTQLTIPFQDITTMFQLIEGETFSPIVQTPPPGPGIPTITNGASLDKIVVQSKRGLNAPVAIVVTLESEIYSIAGAVLNSIPGGKMRQSFPGWSVGRDGPKSWITFYNAPITTDVGRTTFPYIIFVQQHGKNIGDKPAIGVIDPDVENDTAH